MYDKQVKMNHPLNKTNHRRLVYKHSPSSLSLGHDQEPVVKVPESQIEIATILEQPEEDHLSQGLRRQINHSNHHRGSREP